MGKMKSKIANSLAGKTELNKKALTMKNAWDEVDKILQTSVKPPGNKTIKKK